MKKKLISLLVAGWLVFLPIKASAQGQEQGQPPNQPPVKHQLNPELTNCLKQKMGDAIFEEVKSGEREPSEAEKEAGKECFEKYGQDLMKRPPGKEKPNLDFAPGTDACLKQKLGADYKDKLRSAKSRQEGEALMSQTRDCFGDKVGQGDRKPLPDNVRQCVENTVGKAAAEKMFKGEKPTNDSAEKNKLESAGCFKGFNRGQGKMEDIPPDKRQCIEGIMGSVQGEPSETQRDEIANKCFEGRKPGEGEPGNNDHPRLPKEVENCLQSSIGDSFKTKPPEQMNQDERDKANSCFSNNNFQPQAGGKPGEQRPPNMNEETMKCVERVSGKSIQSRDFDDETKGKIDKECFGGRKPEEENKPEENRTMNPQPALDIKNCQNGPAGEVNEQCNKDEHFNEPPQQERQSNQPLPNNQISPPNNVVSPPPSGVDIQPQPSPFVGQPNNEIRDDGGQYCQENPSACPEQISP